MTSKWINMNVLSLDEERVVVERQDERMNLPGIELVHLADSRAAAVIDPSACRLRRRPCCGVVGLNRK
jgi:hypothetical protein